MTRRKFYVFALWLPLILPALFYGIDLLFQEPPHMDEYGNTVLQFRQSGIGLFFFLPGIYGGAQYAVFALWALWKYGEKTAPQLARVSWKFPLLFLPFCLGGLLIWQIINTDFIHPDHHITFDGLFLSLCAILTLLFGYFYVILVHLLTYILTEIKLIKD